MRAIIADALEHHPRGRHGPLRHQAQQHRFHRRGVLKLLDFGLAKLPKIVAATADTDTLTETHSGGAVVFGDTAIHGGTPAYMSPEALEGVASARPALDLWALGVVLFESITGLRPFGGATRDEIKMAARGGLQQAPSALNAAIPLDVDRYLLRTLSVQPSQRPAGAREVHDDLVRLRLALH